MLGCVRPERIASQIIAIFAGSDMAIQRRSTGGQKKTTYQVATSTVAIWTSKNAALIMGAGTRAHRSTVPIPNMAEVVIEEDNTSCGTR
jgi:hypothetical protein